MSIRKNISTILNNFRGYKTNRKIVVIESDDWGTIRSTNSREVENIYRRFNANINPYNLFDSLESNEDISCLFNVLTEFKSKRDGGYPKFTANCIVRNPDFDKIKDSDFQFYYTEDVRKTFERNIESSKVYDLWQRGFKENLFVPQLHGREHLNSRIWMEKLRMDGLERELFNYKMWGAVPHNQEDFYYRNSMAGLNYQNEIELVDIYKAIDESVLSFYELFGFYSQSYIANNYIWDPLVEERLASNKVEYIQGQSSQLFSSYWRNKTGKKVEKHYMGQKNEFNQLYLIRNCFFEPIYEKSDSFASVNDCLKEIKLAFMMGKPAVISTHRVNYIGGISKTNRDSGLNKLSKLLGKIVELFPDVEFLSTPELGQIIKDRSND